MTINLKRVNCINSGGLGAGYGYGRGIYGYGGYSPYGKKFKDLINLLDLYFQSLSYYTITCFS